MIVTCPNCETKFEIPDDKYRPGRKARCSNCGFVFPLPDFPADEVPVEDELDIPGEETPAPSLSDDADAAFEDGFSEPETDDVETDGGEGIAAPPASPDDIVAPGSKPDNNSGKKRSKKNLLLILGVVLVVALLGYGGVLVYSAFFAPPKTADPQRATDGSVVESLGGRTSSEDQEKEAARQAAVSRLSLENVRQHTVTDNEKTGPMVVVEGAVANNFDTPKDLILLEITLYDSKGNALVLREQYCGVTLSLLQLRTLSKAAIESALANQVVILRNNTDIIPGGRVPFSTVFFDLPNSAYEFEVKIVDVQNPATK